MRDGSDWHPKLHETVAQITGMKSERSDAAMPVENVISIYLGIGVLSENFTTVFMLFCSRYQ